MNVHDNLLFDSSFTELLESMNRPGISLVGSYLTLDPGFDDGKNRNQIEYANLIPVIKPNLRGLKDREKINAILNAFEEVREIYQKRYAIE